MKITSTSTNSNAESAEVTEPSTPSTAEMIELELMLLVIDWMSDWLIPKPASQVSRLVMSCWICVEYSGSRVASWATPMTSPKISPSRIAKMTMTRVRLASQRGAPCRIIQPRIGFTVTVSTTARKIGARMPGTWWIPAATTTAAAKPRMMIKPRGRPDVPCPEVGDGGSEFRESSAAAGSRVLGGVAEAGSAGLSVICCRPFCWCAAAAVGATSSARRIPSGGGGQVRRSPAGRPTLERQDSGEVAIVPPPECGSGRR